MRSFAIHKNKLAVQGYIQAIFSLLERILHYATK